MAEKNDEFIIIKNVLVRYKGRYPFVEIPNGVTCIGKQAFYYNEIVQSVKLPETVTTIDSEAFSHCVNLRRVELPESLTSIGHEAFSHCRLQSLTFPCGLIQIESGAFSCCWNLNEIALPESINHIKSRVFEHTDIYEIEIPDSVEHIESEAFSSCSKLKRVVLPEHLKSVGWHAFYNCRELTDITFPPTLCDIAGEAFSGCKGIIGENGFIIINNDLSYYYGNDRVLQIPEGVKSINGRVFYQNRRITKVVLPDSLTSIGAVAFGECINLRDINISTRVTNLERNAFNGCRRLANENGFVIFNKVLLGYYGHSAIVEIPEGVETIGAGSFIGYDNYEIEEIVIPESVNVIEKDSFSCCRNLRRVLMPERMKQIDEGAFSFCDHLKSITIPEGIEVLSWNTFWDCRSLEEIRLPKSLKTIEYSAISDCSSLKSISIPEGVEKIGGRQFEGCDCLLEIDIPETVTCFEDCDLKGVRLNISKLGRSFKIIPQHRWDARDERLLWQMLNDPSFETFKSIKTTAYKIALAERLYPEYKEYGAFLKKNISKAIRDAVSFDDYELLASLKGINLIEPAKFDEELSKAQEEIMKMRDAEYKEAEKDISNENIINITWLKRLATELEMLGRYRDTSDLLKACYERIAFLEERKIEEKYANAIKSMNQFGGMSWVVLGPAIKDFYEIRNYKDSAALIEECKRRLDITQKENREKAYQKALDAYDSFDGTNWEKLEEAIDIFEHLSGYKDSDERLTEYYKKYWGVNIQGRR